MTCREVCMTFLSPLSKHCLFALGTLYFVRFTDIRQETIYAHLAAFIAKFLEESRSVASILATSRFLGRPGWEGCQSTLWDCFGGRICRHVDHASPKTVRQRTFRTISTRSPAQPKSGEYTHRPYMTYNWNMEKIYFFVSWKSIFIIKSGWMIPFRTILLLCVSISLILLLFYDSEDITGPFPLNTVPYRQH